MNGRVQTERGKSESLLALLSSFAVTVSASLVSTGRRAVRPGVRRARRPDVGVGASADGACPAADRSPESMQRALRRLEAELHALEDQHRTALAEERGAR